MVGNKVTYEENGTDNVYYTYDSSDNLVSMNLNGVEYYYIRNAQGDIIGLFDKTGATVASYIYDSWGKIISIDGTLKNSVGIKNPYRYRGYRHDTETGLYYLQSRYYNPEWGRFINADAAVGQIGNIQGHNMFQYCFNNPINMDDPSGHWPKLSTILTAVAVVATVVAVAAVVVATAGAAAPAFTLVGGVAIGSTSGIVAGATAVAGVAFAIAKVAAAGAVVTKAAETISKNMSKSHTVYTLSDSKTGEVKYVGRTTNYEKRMTAHQKEGSRTAGLVPSARIDNLNYIQARGVEQLGMLYYNTHISKGGANKIWGISSKNPRGVTYSLAGLDIGNYLYNQISNEVLSWTGN